MNRESASSNQSGDLSERRVHCLAGSEGRRSAEMPPRPHRGWRVGGIARVCLGLALLTLTLVNVRATCFQFTQEHVDLLGLVWNAADAQLGLMASDDIHGRVYASNECVVVCPESMMFTLPGGTPLGNEGDAMWIFPQTPYPSVPHLGVSSEGIPAGVFTDPLIVRLTRIEGPGQFIVWQTGGLGSFDVVMDTRDGLSANDSLTIPVGGHAHYNWGFSTSGVYRAYFQAEGRLIGPATNTVSPETSFTFHILPLRPFEIWTATNWPCECANSIIAAAADPDGDQAANALEYGAGTDPTRFTTNAWFEFTTVSTNGQTYGAVTFNKAKSATDATCEVVASGDVTTTHWQVLTNLHRLVDQPATERTTIRDEMPFRTVPQRFYKLRVQVN